MNDRWIRHSHSIAKSSRNDFAVTITVYLDIVGLFETGWIIYKHNDYNRYNYGKYK